MGTTAESETPSRDGDARRKRRQERRRRAQARQFDTSVPSPCIAVCELEEGTGLCLGCRRHVDEIRDWPVMTADEKQATLSRIEARKAADAGGASGSSAGGDGDAA